MAISYPPAGRTKLAKILLAIRDRLIAQHVFNDDTCYLSMRMNPPAHLQAPQYAIILPLTQRVVPETDAGAGRYATIMDGRMNVYVRNRLALDEAYKHHYWLTHEDGGILNKTHEVVDALHLYMPVCNDEPLLEEPMKLLFWGEPHHDYSQAENGDICIEFNIRWMLDLCVAKDV